MSSINSVSSSSSNSAAIYQEMLARQLAAKSSQAKAQPQTPATPLPTGDVDHDGDSH